MATNFEALQSSVGSNYPFDDQVYRTGLAQAGLDPDAENVAGKGFDMALVTMIPFLIMSADVKEGGYAVSLDRDALWRLRRDLLDKWDVPLPSGGPYLRDRTYKW